MINDVNMGLCHGSLSASAAAAAKDDTVKWYLDTNVEITVGVPMAPPLSTDDSFVIRLLLLLLDYPLLESDDVIPRFKVRIGPYGKLPSVERGGGIGTPTIISALVSGYHLTVSSLAATAVALRDP
ncbi:hypothetical protein Tco_0458820 [Tanacetum coccineum]